jgi:hypothetical protein
MKLTTTAPKALVIHCGDPRFQKAFADFLDRKLGLPQGSYIPLVIPGSIGGMTVASLPKNAKVLGEQIGLYLAHFPNLPVIVINHEDCKGYAAIMEKLQAVIRIPVDAKQVADLGVAARTIASIARQHGHSPKFDLYMARIGPDSEVVFDKVMSEGA